MGSKSSVKLQELQWNEVRQDVVALNPTLAKIIDELNPNSKYTLFKASYPFGSEILKNGKFYLPSENNHLIPFESDQVDRHIQESLGYNLASNPVTFVLKNSLELFVTAEDRIIPFGLISPGIIFGLWRVLDSPTNVISHAAMSLWDMTAGARSLFMLPKIAEDAAHDRLKRKYLISVDKPKSLKDHWEIFRAIANSPAFNEKWNLEVLFFSKKWFETLNDKKWTNFRLYLLDTAWRGSEFWRNQFTWDLTFSRVHSARGIKPSSYIADIVKHLLAIGVGSIPGFTPATDNSFAPIQGLQKAYIEEYGLKIYAPIIMQPNLFLMDNPSHPVYYSMQFHTAIELSQKSSKRSSTIMDMYAVNSLLKKYLEDIKKDYLNIKATPLCELSKLVDYAFFHSSTELYNGMRSSDEIMTEDATFNGICKHFPDKTISKNSPFFNGCVRINSHKGATK